MDVEKSRLTLSHGDITMSAELPWDANLDDFMHAFVGCLIGITFSSSGLLSHIRDWCDERIESEEKD